MPVDFDTVPNRRGTNCFKYDFAREMGMPEDVLPLWVADMDFPTAPAVLERLHALAEHGIFGYTGVKDAYFSAVHNWYAQRFGWETQRSWLVTTPGVVFAIAIAIRAFKQKGDAILIQQPVYYPFANKVTENDRQLVVNPLVLKNGRYVNSTSRNNGTNRNVRVTTTFCTFTLDHFSRRIRLDNPTSV